MQVSDRWTGDGRMTDVGVATVALMTQSSRAKMIGYNSWLLHMLSPFSFFLLNFVAFLLQNNTTLLEAFFQSALIMLILTRDFSQYPYALWKVDSLYICGAHQSFGRCTHVGLCDQTLITIIKSPTATEHVALIPPGHCLLCVPLISEVEIGSLPGVEIGGFSVSRNSAAKKKKRNNKVRGQLKTMLLAAGSWDGSGGWYAVKKGTKAPLLVLDWEISRYTGLFRQITSQLLHHCSSIKCCWGCH